jgi:hypothetical protein
MPKLTAEEQIEYDKRVAKLMLETGNWSKQ